MATCKFCGQWVAGTWTECVNCRNRAIKDPRFRNKQVYNLLKKMNIKLT